MQNYRVCQVCGSTYDMSSDPVCPYCNPGGNYTPIDDFISGGAGGVSPTIPADMADGFFSGNGVPLTAPMGGGIPPTTAKMPPTAPSGNMGKTQVHGMVGNIMPVVGWLVIIDGPDKGIDFRLHAGVNAVGRNADQDVCLANDMTVSGEHFSVVYDMKGHNYFVAPGKGKNLVYVNDSPLIGNAIPLKDGDMIRAAGTTLVFVPFNYRPGRKRTK